MFLPDTCDIGIKEKKVNADRAEGCLLQQLTDVGNVIFSWFNIHLLHTSQRAQSVCSSTLTEAGENAILSLIENNT